jgi:hypothetical protein
LDLPVAVISHRLPTRLRFKLASRKGDGDFFTAVVKKLAGLENIERLEANPGTGSVLMVGKDLDPSDIAGFAEQNGLFTLNVLPAEAVPLSRRITEPIGRVSGSLNRLTGGEIDLAGLAFLALLGTGVYQIARGNLRAPPWYTAFWYALGVFTKSLADRKGDDSKA